MLRLLVAVVFLCLNVQGSEKITFKSAKSSSSYYQMSVQLGEVVNKATDNFLQFTIEESQGSVQNLKEARKRKGNYLFTTPPGLIQTALSSNGAFKKDNPKDYEKIKALFTIPYLSMHFVVRKDANIKSFADLKGKTILVGKGTFGAKEGKKYIELFGLKDQVKIVESELSGAVNAMKNGRIDGFVTSGSFPAPNVLEISSSVDIAVLSLDDEQIKLTKRNEIIIPKGTYKGIDYDVTTTTLPVGIYATNMSDDTAYKLVKAFWESKAELEKGNAWWKSVGFKNLQDLKINLHNGAKKYYQEQKVELGK